MTPPAPVRLSMIDLFAEPLTHLRRDGAADDVVAAARRERDDQPDRPVGIIRLRQRPKPSAVDQQSAAASSTVRAVGASLVPPNSKSTPTITHASMPPFFTDCSHLFISLTHERRRNSWGDFIHDGRALQLANCFLTSGVSCGGGQAACAACR
jgi:hypothetical protein